MTDVIDQKSLLMEKSIQTIDDLQIVIRMVEEKLKQTSRLVILLFESSIETLGDTDTSSYQHDIKLEKEVCDENSMFVPDQKMVVKEESVPPDDAILELPEYDKFDESMENGDSEYSGDEKDDDPDFKWNRKAIGMKMKVGRKLGGKNKTKKKVARDITDKVEIKIEKKPKKPKPRDCERNWGGLCVECGKYFKRLSAHKLNFHTKRMKQYKCPFCDLEFNTHSYGKFFNHKQLCEAATTGILKYECETCHMKFPSIKKSIDHQRGCNNKYKPLKKYKSIHVCTYEGCDYVGHNKERLENHINDKHLGLPKIKRYSCETCGNAYANLKVLKHHIRQVHTKIRDYHCSYCGASFASSHILRNHQLIHSDALTQICPYCSKGFKQKSVLYRHKLSCPMNHSK